MRPTSLLPWRFPDEPAPRVAVIASTEHVIVLTTHGNRTSEVATGATLVPGERVLVTCGDETWTAIVRRRHPLHGAVVEELPSSA